MNASASRSIQTIPNTFPPPRIFSLSSGQGARNVEIARQWIALSGIVADLATPHGDFPRRAHLHISFGSLTEKPASWGARFWEEDAPVGAPPIEWVLFSPIPVESVQDALQLLNQTHNLVTSFGCH